jgi:hypothetical protein
MAVKLTSTGVIYPDNSKENSNPIDTGELISVTNFTSNGTWTKPVGCTKVHVIIVGGGGGGCGYGESGGAGGYAEKLIDVTSVSTVAVIIGGAGGGSGYHSGAGDGGTSSFGSYVSATGGRGANKTWGHTGGHGGYGSGGDVNLWGGSGRSHYNHGNNAADSGQGGGSFFGQTPSGHHSQWYAHYNENNGTFPAGAGGAGEASAYSRGGHGNKGTCIVYAYE